MYADTLKLSFEYSEIMGKALSSLSESSAAKLFAPETLRRASVARSGRELFQLVHDLQLPELKTWAVPNEPTHELDKMLATGILPGIAETQARLAAMKIRFQTQRGSWSDDMGDGAMTGAAVGGFVGGFAGGTVGSMAGALAGGVGGAVGGAINHVMGWKSPQTD